MTDLGFGRDGLGFYQWLGKVHGWMINVVDGVACFDFFSFDDDVMM